jgi:hypothetical protein
MRLGNREVASPDTRQPPPHPCSMPTRRRRLIPAFDNDQDLNWNIAAIT